jgi:hypothetical protein
MNSAATKPTLLRRHGIHFVCLFAFFLTSLLVLQQERTIESQRTLIHELFRDSLELSQLKMASVERSRR